MLKTFVPILIGLGISPILGMENYPTLKFSAQLLGRNSLERLTAFGLAMVLNFILIVVVISIIELILLRAISEGRNSNR